MAVDPNKVYHGRPCKRCGNTLRWKSDRSCVECKRKDEREKKREQQCSPECRKRFNDAKRRWWHKADGGYIQWRKRKLAAQRENLQRKKEELDVAVKRLTG